MWKVISVDTSRNEKPTDLSVLVNGLWWSDKGGDSHKAHNSFIPTYLWTAPLPIRWWMVPLIGWLRHNQLVIIPLKMLVTLVRGIKKLSMWDGSIWSSAKYQLTAFQVISKSRKHIYFLVSCENRWSQKNIKRFRRSPTTCLGDPSVLLYYL